MEDDKASKKRIPIFSDKKTLHVSTGNTVEWQRLRRRTNLQSHEELELCLSEVLNDWMKKSPTSASTTDGTLRINNNDDDDDINGGDKKCGGGVGSNKNAGIGGDRDALKYAVKAFPSADATSDDILETIELLLKELDVEFVDALVVALPGFGGGGGGEGGGVGGGSGGRSGLTIEDIVPVVAKPRGREDGSTMKKCHGGIEEAMKTWRVLEKLADSGRASSLGVSDLSKIQLEELLREAKIKPIVNQVNLTTCCVIADDLKELAKDHDVQLMIHNDPRLMIDDAGLDRLLLSAVTNSWNISEEGATGWSPTCLLRYSAMVKGRGVIKTKGYLLKAAKL